MFTDDRCKEFYFNRMMFMVKHGTPFCIPSFSNRYIRGFYPEENFDNKDIRVILDNLNFFHIKDINNIPSQFRCENETSGIATCFLNIEDASKFYLDRCHDSIKECDEEIEKEYKLIQDYDDRIKNIDENDPDGHEKLSNLDIMKKQALLRIDDIKSTRNHLCILLDTYDDK